MCKISNKKRKTIRIFEECIFPYSEKHKSQIIRDYIYEFADRIDPTGYVEHQMAELSNGDYNFIDGAGCDFCDGTECKCISVTVQSDGSWKFDVSNIGRYGENSKGLKEGALRIVIYNAVSDSVDYFFLPKSFWENLTIKIHGTSQVAHIIGTYSKRKKDTYLISGHNMNIFRVGSFIELAQLPADTPESYFTKQLDLLAA